MEKAKKCAKFSFIDCFAAVKNTIGSIEDFKKIVNLKGYVASTSCLVDHPKVLNEVSILINEVFAENGKYINVSLWE